MGLACSKMCFIKYGNSSKFVFESDFFSYRDVVKSLVPNLQVGKYVMVCLCKFSSLSLGVKLELFKTLRLEVHTLRFEGKVSFLRFMELQ